MGQLHSLLKFRRALRQIRLETHILRDIINIKLLEVVQRYCIYYLVIWIPKCRLLAVYHNLLFIVHRPSSLYIFRTSRRILFQFILWRRLQARALPLTQLLSALLYPVLQRHTLCILILFLYLSIDFFIRIKVKALKLLLLLFCTSFRELLIINRTYKILPARILIYRLGQFFLVVRL